MTSILFATTNFAKKKLYTPIFAEYGLMCLTLPDVGLESASPAEMGSTLAENALLKARAVHSVRWPLVFSNDAGLEIDALNGEPGLKTRRWNGHFPPDVDDQTWLNYLLQRLDGVPLEKRSARFVSAWVLITPDGQEHIHHAIPPAFRIATNPIRPMIPGSPMSAVRLGPADDAQHRSRLLAQEMRRWGILETFT